MKDSVTVHALRDIYPGDEITIDYAMVSGSSGQRPDARI